MCTTLNLNEQAGPIDMDHARRGKSKNASSCTIGSRLNQGNTRSQHAEESPRHHNSQEPSVPTNITDTSMGNKSDINNMNSKIDSVVLTVNELKSDYQQLKQDNVSL